jgi:tetratricopeptide (TPR) repeat protein
MRAGFLLCLVAAASVLAQSGGISERIQRALAPSGESVVAGQALAGGNFARVAELLAATKANSAAERAELLSLRGAVWFLDGKMSASAAAFEEAAALAPLTDGDRFTLAMALIKLGDDAHARVQLESLAQKNPAQALYLYWLGRLDYDQRRYKEAVVKLDKATQLDPRSARAWDSLGLAFDMQGQREHALGAFDKAVKLNHAQTHPSPWPPHDLGYLLLRLEKPAEAEAALRESLRYPPKLAQTHYYLGRALEKEGRDTEAVEEYRSAVSADTSSPDACYSLAMLYRKLHRGPEAQAMFAEFRKRRQASNQ